MKGTRVGDSCEFRLETSSFFLSSERHSSTPSAGSLICTFTPTCSANERSTV